MKHIILIIMLLVSVASFGQTSYKIEGKTITSTSVEKQKTVDKNTGYTFKDKQGVEHQVLITKNGRCYYWKKSSKTGNNYKAYMDEQTSRQIASQMGIEYKERTKKN